MENNGYYHGHLDRTDDGSSPLNVMSQAEMLVFHAITVKIGHTTRDKLTDYWATTNQSHTYFYSTIRKRDRYIHILRFVHFTDKKNEPDMTDEYSDRLWNMRNLYDILNKRVSKFYALLNTWT
jgi:hypothetical protein